MTIERTKSRKLALQILYQNEFHQVPSETQLDSLVNNCLDSQKKMTQEELDYSIKILQNLYQHQKTIDQMIQSHSPNWTLKRMSLVDLNIMRVAILEILYHPEIPNKVSINEAIELSKIFGSQKSPAFINGILDKFVNTQKKSKTHIT